MEEVIGPIFFIASVFGFPLLRRQMIHRHQMELMQAQQTLPTGTAPSGATPGAADLALNLPEPHRLYALAILCRIQDAPRDLDARTRYTLEQARTEYLPGTLSAYLNLTPGARHGLQTRGLNPEAMLREQLELINQGVTDALAHDHVAADRMLTQGRFLAQKFETREERVLRELTELKVR